MGNEGPPRIEDSINRASGRTTTSNSGTAEAGKLANQLWMGGAQRNLTYAYNAPYSARWTQDMLNRVYTQASLAAGKEIRDPVEFQKWWKKAVDGAARVYQASGGAIKLTPAMVLDQMAETSLANGGGSGSGGGSSVAKSVTEISEGTAWSVLDSALRNAMGRAPTDSELRQFVSKASDIAHRNPTVTKSSGSDSNGNSRSTTVTQAGANENDYALAAMKMAATPEAGAFQVASTYFNALRAALDSPVELSNPGGR